MKFGPVNTVNGWNPGPCGTMSVPVAYSSTRQLPPDTATAPLIRICARSLAETTDGRTPCSANAQSGDVRSIRQPGIGLLVAVIRSSQRPDIVTVVLVRAK